VEIVLHVKRINFVRIVLWLFYLKSFEDWKRYSEEKKMSLVDVVIEYEHEQKGRTREQIFEGLATAWTVMKEAVQNGFPKT